MKKSFIFAAIALAFAANVNASDRSYTFVEGGYANWDQTVDGPYIKGSYDFGPVYAFGQYSYLEARDDFGLTLPNIDASEVGVGYNYTVHDRVDLIGELAYQYFDFDFSEIEVYRASIGARITPFKNADLLVRVNHLDSGDVEKATTGTVGFGYDFTPRWGAYSEVEVGENDYEQFTVGVRATF